MIQWNEEHQCLVDYMGLPLTRTEATQMAELCRKHLKRSPQQLADSHNALMHKHHGGIRPGEHAVAEDMK